MNRISGDSALAQYLSNNAAQSAKSAGTPFQQLLASASGSLSVNAAGAAVAASSVSPASVTVSADTQFVSDLNVALNAYGIGAPPSLRITSGPDGLQLDDDPRNAKFQAMLKSDPALAQRIAGKLSSAVLDRKTALSDAIQGFGGPNPSGQMKDFLNDFEKSEQPQGYSLAFNGATATVEELDADGWQAVKNKDQINSDLLAAYARYLVKFGVTTEKHKDDKGADANTDADIDLKKKLAAAAAA